MRAFKKRTNTGFTLLELLVVITIIAVSTASVSLALRDNSQLTLEREAQRLAVLFESARAQSRASGIPVVWRSNADGFRFEGLPDDALPRHWLSPGVAATSLSIKAQGTAAASIQLGPEPVIAPQSVDLVLQHQTWRVSTDGLRPFAVQQVFKP